VGLRGRRDAALGPDRRLEVLALPAHTPGHLGLWDARTGAAIVIDAVLSDGIYDRAGQRLIPPRYYDAAAYEATIPAPARASRAPAHGALRRHGPPGRARVPRLLAWLGQAIRGAVRSAGTTDLRALTDEVNEAVGPFPSLTHELAASVRAHLAELQRRASAASSRLKRSGSSRCGA
jgi:glyoxylase-like metal-dependent hydrolase (beta-lactamase superfamily II)